MLKLFDAAFAKCVYLKPGGDVHLEQDEEAALLRAIRRANVKIRARARRRDRSQFLVLSLVLTLLSLGCAKTMFVVELEKGGTATLELHGGSKLKVKGPGELAYVCRTWGDSYFQVGDWTCSGGQLSDNGAALGGIVAEAVVRAIVSSTGVGAAGGAASAAGALLGSSVEPPPGTDAEVRAVVEKLLEGAPAP